MTYKTKAKKNEYSDGDDIEEALLDAFRSNNVRKRVEKLLKTRKWPFLYHLHKDRHNLLRWYEFKKDAKLLEVGAGCGAVTEVFLKAVNEVYTIDISQRRLDILKARFKKYKNLYVKKQNFIEYNPKFKFDYITSIGVLEYSGKYIDSKTPYLDFLRKIRSLLSKNGEFILAIENKFGLKYWAGIPEDHTGRLFDSIEGYPIEGGIQTFGKKELETLLQRAGFRDIKFYYPYPDYKFVREIYSDEYLPNEDLNHIISALFSSLVDQNLKYNYIFDQARVTRQLIINDMVDLFANSFLVVTK